MVPAGITVTGSGSASGRPDVARVRLAATATLAGVGEAMAAADGAVRSVREALLGGGVPAADLSTAQLSVTAEQVWTEGEGSRVTGYTATHGLELTVRAVDSLGRLLAAALAAGGDAARLDGVQLAIEDDAAVRARARDAAWSDAVARGRQLAALAGRVLGQVIAVEERDPGRDGVFPMAGMRMATAELAVEPGEVSVGVEITVRWELD